MDVSTFGTCVHWVGRVLVWSVRFVADSVSGVRSRFEANSGARVLLHVKQDTGNCEGPLNVHVLTVV
eukprot:m.832039 g.832039  ORF g.832039 m.832039 type:complete len:67 (-) comp23432_c0_seq2:996-1196(-)